jgi:general secretion pathway protein L
MKIPVARLGHGLLPRMRLRPPRAAAPDPRGHGPRPAVARAEAADGPPAPPGVALVPAEDVTLLSVALPGVPAAQRTAAAAFAAEDRLAQPLDAVQVVVLGAAPDPDSWLLAVIGRTALARHAARHAAPLRLVPETLLLAVPPPGAATAWAGPRRVLLRLADGTGLAVPAAALPVALALAGSPRLLLAGGHLPDGLAAPPGPPLAAIAPGLDLRRTGTAMLAGPARRLAWLAAGVAAAHVALAAAGVAVLSGRAGQAETALRAALQARGSAAAGDEDAALAAVLAPPPAALDGGFLALFGAVAAAMAQAPGAATLREVTYARDPVRLTLTVQAADLATLGTVQDSLAARGLTVRAEGTDRSGGVAVVRLAVTGGAP